MTLDAENVTLKNRNRHVPIRWAGGDSLKHGKALRVISCAGCRMQGATPKSSDESYMFNCRSLSAADMSMTCHELSCHKVKLQIDQDAADCLVGAYRCLLVGHWRCALDQAMAAPSAVATRRCCCHCLYRLHVHSF